MHSLRLLLARIFTDIADLFAKIAFAIRASGFLLTAIDVGKRLARGVNDFETAGIVSTVQGAGGNASSQFL